KVFLVEARWGGEALEPIAVEGGIALAAGGETRQCAHLRIPEVSPSDEHDAPIVHHGHVVDLVVAAGEIEGGDAGGAEVGIEGAGGGDLGCVLVGVGCALPVIANEKDLPVAAHLQRRDGAKRAGISEGEKDSAAAEV